MTFVLHNYFWKMIKQKTTHFEILSLRSRMTRGGGGLSTYSFYYKIASLLLAMTRGVGIYVIR